MTVKVCVCIKRYVAKIGTEIDTEVEQGHPFKSCLQDSVLHFFPICFMGTQRRQRKRRR